MPGVASSDLINRVEQLVHLRPESAEFASVQHRELFELGSAGRRRAHEDSSAVVWVDDALDQPMVDSPADEFTGGVEFDMKLVGDVGQRRPIT